MRKSNAKLKPVPDPEPLLKLDLGSGLNPREGFKRVDLHAEADYKVDLFTFPWPWKDNSAEEIHCSHFFEHVPALLRGKFMDEVFRVLVPGGKAMFITPHYGSVRAVQDFTHEWPPLGENSYLYFNKIWRAQNLLTFGPYDLKCDFDFTYGYQLSGPYASKNEEARTFAATHYRNVVDDLHVTLISKKEG